MTSSRGRANKGRSGQAVTLSGAKKLTKMGALIHQSWVRLSDAEKRMYGYDFGKYKIGKEKL